MHKHKTHLKFVIVSFWEEGGRACACGRSIAFGCEISSGTVKCITFMGKGNCVARAQRCGKNLY